jgi:uncharacterized protein with FMN-binding domain
MRRVVPAIVVTLLGLGALAAFKSTPGVAARPIALGPQRTTSTTPPATAPPTSGNGPTPTAPPTSPPTTQPKPVDSTPKTYDGDPVDNRFGTVQVRVTVQGKQITSVDPVQMPFDHARSQYISQQAGPYLRQEALQAQSAQIQIVSGATYTSESYARSLQSALDRAGI